MKLKFTKIVFVFSLVTCFISLISTSDERLALFFEKRISFPLRNLLSYATSALGFSVYEALIVFSPLIVLALVLYVLFAKKEFVRRRFFGVITLLTLCFSVFLLNFIVPMSCPDFTENIISTDYTIDKDELESSALRLASDISAISENELEFPDKLTLKEELGEWLLNNTRPLDKSAICLPRIKEPYVSGLFSRLGILALYSPLTGEVNLNSAVPNYVKPVSIAHEYAHFLGAGSEADASFLGFVSCYRSANQYIRYSGMMYALEYLLSDLSQLNKTLYRQILDSLPDYAVNDLKNWNEFSSKYYGGKTSIVSDKLNNVCLDAVDKHGRESYSKLSVLVARYITLFPSSA